MGNVTIKFKRGLSQKLTLQGPIDVLIDGSEAMKVDPDKSVVIDMKEGPHDVKLWIANQGKEMGLVNTKVDVHPNNKYEVTYEYNTLSGNGKVTTTVSS
ncbi:MAG: hypothetical protein FWH44_02445 [Methanomassiliicoccaceae archaeon]|nr:hypothetical protein [Methanomassiliicoccaceae archaeon]